MALELCRSKSAAASATEPSADVSTCGVLITEIHYAPGSQLFEKLVSWTTLPVDGVKFFSGTATYLKEFEVQALLPAEGGRFGRPFGGWPVRAGPIESCFRDQPHIHPGDRETARSECRQVNALRNRGQSNSRLAMRQQIG